MILSNVDRHHRRKYDIPAYISNPFLYSDSNKIHLDFSNESKEKQKPLLVLKAWTVFFFYSNGWHIIDGFVDQVI